MSKIFSAPEMNILKKSITEEVGGVACMYYVCQDRAKIPVADLNLLK